ncbi:multidrug and toxin extrusion protein 2-like [Ptychodera flava]|uniref:multidrug and toxin extrusion protein 2-like n=1 Tax=Ptychodera flava TaxID=63121 RepID=UPI00396A877E
MENGGTRDTTTGDVRNGDAGGAPGKKGGEFDFSSVELNSSMVKVPDGKNKTESCPSEDKDDKNTVDVVIAVVQEDSTACSCCPPFCRHKIPTDWKPEVRALLKLAWPTVLTYLLMMLMSMVSIIFCGQLGDAQLGAAAIAQSIVSIMGICIGLGVSTACDTLFSQTFGSKNKKRVGIYLQQSLVIMGLLVFPVWGLLLNAEYFLYNFGIEAIVIKLAGTYIKCLLAGIPAGYLFTIVAKYLQNQSIVLPILVIAAITNVINVLLHYILVFPARLGVSGAAIAQVLSQWIMALTLISYILYKKLHLPTWPGWTMMCFKDWGHFGRLGVAGLFMVSIEWWALELGTMLSGALGELQLSSQAILYQLSAMAFMWPLGFSLAASVRVGNALGACDKNSAKTTSKVAMICTWMCAAGVAISFLCLKSVVARAFTSDQKVVDMVSSALPLVAVFHFFDSSAACCGGILRGCGRQRLGAFLDALGYYFLGLPLGISLMFIVHMGIHGLWWGYAAASILQAVIFLIAVIRTNWDRQEHKAQVRSSMVKKDKYKAVHNPDGKKSSKKLVINMTYNPMNGEVNNKETVEEDEVDLLKDGEDDQQSSASEPFHLSANVLIRRVALVVIAIGLFIFGLIGSQIMTVPYDELLLASTTAPNISASSITAHF